MENDTSMKLGDFKNPSAQAQTGGYEVLSTTVRENTCKIMIRKWIATNPFNDFVAFLRRRIIGQEDVMLMATYIYRHLESIANNLPSNNNVLLAAPSGCGKTETFRSIKMYFEKYIPDLIIYQLDLTSFGEGTKGNDTVDIIRPLFDDVLQNANDKIALIFLDEFDKKIMPVNKMEGENTNLFVQFKLLTLLEGREVASSKKIGDKVYDEKIVHTKNCMFIGLGSYDEYRKVNPYTSDHYEYITKQNMVELGASFELLGRFVDVINYHRLDEDALNIIIDKTVKDEEGAFGNRYRIIIGDVMRRYMLDNANNEYGCRFLSSIVHQSVIKAYQYMLIENMATSVNAIHIIDPDNFEVGTLDEEAM